MNDSHLGMNPILAFNKMAEHLRMSFFYNAYIFFDFD